MNRARYAVVWWVSRHLHAALTRIADQPCADHQIRVPACTAHHPCAACRAERALDLTDDTQTL